MKPALSNNLSFRYIILVILLLVIVGSFGHYIWQKTTSTGEFKCSTHRDTYNVKEVTINNKKLKVLTSDSPTKWEYGLMNVKSKNDICGNDGMIFNFPIAMPQTFWNKNTLVDLDIYWMKGGEKVGQDKLPAITKSGLTTISSPEAVDAVVEIIK